MNFAEVGSSVLAIESYEKSECFYNFGVLLHRSFLQKRYGTVRRPCLFLAVDQSTKRVLTPDCSQFGCASSFHEIQIPLTSLNQNKKMNNQQTNN
mmetsp:Transcript_42807/g.49214  ORF Transcript_42807/g.49214 Transcript_42807/m.49214 type:complete len:95 (+) Transcript_42807:479-763(+)